MKLWVFGVVFAVLFPFVLSCSGEEHASDIQIRAAIKQLATNYSDEKAPKERFEVFYANPYRSTELLISALRPVRRGRYTKHPQVVWMIRALRSLTGLDFRASTRADLTADEVHFLDADATTGQVLFFGTWMSRDAVWTAPSDAQIAIIGKWREWFAKHGRDHKYVNDPDFDHWYF
jgi:hypothetical protein